MAGKPKGSTKSGGRIKGTPNKTTSEIRAAFKEFVEFNLDRMQKWIEQVAQEDPSKALDHLTKFAEYTTPKLARTEHTGLDGQDIKSQNNIILDVNFHDVKS